MEPSERHANLVERMVGGVTGKVIHVVDPNIVLDEVDIERMLSRVDPNDLLDRVDVNALLARVDPNALLDRVDPNALLDRVDVNQLMARVDIDALLAQADVEELVRRSGVPEIVASSTSHMFGSLIDLIRRQVVGLDTILHRAIDGVMRRERQPADFGPAALLPSSPDADADGRLTVTGRYAGAFSRLLAAAADMVVASIVFTLSVAGLNVLIGTFFNASVSPDHVGFWGLTAWFGWLFVYSWGSLTIAGRTPGMTLVGIRVVTTKGSPIGLGQALVRTLVLPVSLMAFGLGLLMALPHPQHRALHDLAAHTVVVYDWGDRAAELPGPLSAYVSRHVGM